MVHSPYKDYLEPEQMNRISASKVWQLALLQLLLGFSLLAYGDMYVDRSIVVFPPQSSPRQDVKVTNTDDETIYIAVEVYRVLHPGSEDEERIQHNDPKVLKLLATPNKLVIPPNGQKLVRIMNLDRDSEEERVYRINVTPIVPPLEENVSQLRIVVAYQILTIVQPANPVIQLAAERNGKTIRFTNNGNSNMLLSEGKQCDLASADNCEKLESHRLYAGNSWELKLPYDAPVSYSVRSFDGIKQQVFP